MYTTQIIWKKTTKYIQEHNNICDLPYYSQDLQACSSTDKVLKPIFVSAWLIFYCGFLIIYQKINENVKNKFNDEKQK